MKTPKAVKEMMKGLTQVVDEFKKNRADDYNGDDKTPNWQEELALLLGFRFMPFRGEIYDCEFVLSGSESLSRAAQRDGESRARNKARLFYIYLSIREAKILRFLFNVLLGKKYQKRGGVAARPLHPLTLYVAPPKIPKPSSQTVEIFIWRRDLKAFCRRKQKDLEFTIN